jgi:hypothetical protein
LARQAWQPWPDKTPEEIVMFLTELPIDNPRRVLYENFVDIFREIESEEIDPPFYVKPRDMQKVIVEKKVNQYAAVSDQPVQ